MTNIEPSLATNNIDEHLVSTPFPNMRWGRVMYGLFIIIMPIFAFWGIQMDRPDWQSGRLQDYTKLLLLPEASMLFFPLLAYSIISYILILISPSRYSSIFLIRMGVYSGTILALQYSLLTLFALDFPPLLLIVGISPLILSRIPWIKDKWNLKFLGVLFGSAIGAWYLIAAVISETILLPLFFVAVLFAVVSPFWFLLLSLRAAIWLFKNFEAKITVLRGFSLTAWFAIYITAWRFDILKMYELYAALPTEPPNCYIATAATHGHPYFVQSRLIILGNGKQMWINLQLQNLKVTELALQAVFPRFHKILRKVYDVLGKALARRIQHPLLADAAYLVLKPFESISMQILSWFMPEAKQMVHNLYINHQNKSGA